MSFIEISHRRMRLIGKKLRTIEENIRNAICNTEECELLLEKKIQETEQSLNDDINKTKNMIATIKKRLIVLERNAPVPVPVPQPTDSILYVILPYFNYCMFKKRTTLFVDFIERYKNTTGIRLVVAEGVLCDKESQLPDFGSNVFLHIKVELQDRIWIKENLINLAVKQLPSDWKYISWIDADLTFLNTNWVSDTIELLQTNNIVQLFHSAVNMGPDGESTKVEQGFIYMHKHSGKTFHRKSRYGVWHPGFAWACTRNTYETMGGLLEIAILGSADRHTALSLIGMANVSYPGNIGLSYQTKVLELQERCKDFKYDYVKGTLLHHFHGSIADRKYVDRWNILTSNQYNLNTDIYYNDKGVLCLTEKGKRMQADMDEYFLGRNEDATKILA